MFESKYIYTTNGWSFTDNPEFHAKPGQKIKVFRYKLDGSLVVNADISVTGKKENK